MSSKDTVKLVAETKNEDGDDIEIYLDIRVVTKEYADENQVARGRDSPNENPFLPEPKGRIKLSLNPFTMFN